MARASMHDGASDEANGGKESVALAVAELDWEIGVVDRNCRKLLRVLHGGNNHHTYAGTSAATPSGRVLLKEQLDALQLEKATFVERKLALLLKLRPRHPGGFASGTPKKPGRVKPQAVPFNEPLPRLLRPIRRFPSFPVEPVIPPASTEVGAEIKDDGTKTLVAGSDQAAEVLRCLRLPPFVDLRTDGLNFTLPLPSAPCESVVGSVVMAKASPPLDPSSASSPAKPLQPTPSPGGASDPRISSSPKGLPLPVPSQSSTPSPRATPPATAAVAEAQPAVTTGDEIPSEEASGAEPPARAFRALSVSSASASIAPGKFVVEALEATADAAAGDAGRAAVPPPVSSKEARAAAQETAAEGAAVGFHQSVPLSAEPEKDGFKASSCSPVALHPTSPPPALPMPRDFPLLV